VLAADVNDDLLGRVLQAVLRLQLLGDRSPQLRDAGGRRVLRLALLQGLDRRLFDVVRRIEIGLSGPETHHVDALGLQFLGPVGHGERRGRRDFLSSLADLHLAAPF